MNTTHDASRSNRSARRTVRSNRSTGIHQAASGDLQVHRLLALLQRAAGTSESLRIDLPAGESLRMRKLVHRGTQRPVFKVTSVTMGRVVQCESILEYEATYLFDVSSHVTAFREQPVRIHYAIDGQNRWHIPDFVLVIDGVLWFVEVKFRKDVDAAVSARTDQLRQALARLGARYGLLTEAEICREHAVPNALSILRRARHTVDETQVLIALEKLRASGQLPLNAFGWSSAGSLEAVCMAKLILRGLAVVDVLAPLSATTQVSIASSTNPKEGVSWLPAASV